MLSLYRDLRVPMLLHNPLPLQTVHWPLKKFSAYTLTFFQNFFFWWTLLIFGERAPSGVLQRLFCGWVVSTAGQKKLGPISAWLSRMLCYLSPTPPTSQGFLLKVIIEKWYPFFWKLHKCAGPFKTQNCNFCASGPSTLIFCRLDG